LRLNAFLLAKLVPGDESFTYCRQAIPGDSIVPDGYGVIRQKAYGFALDLCLGAGKYYLSLAACISSSFLNNSVSHH